jgi:hypothetical protein
MKKRRIYAASRDAMNRFRVRLPANLFFSRRRDFLNTEVRAHELLLRVQPDAHGRSQQSIDRGFADKCSCKVQANRKVDQDFLSASPPVLKFSSAPFLAFS